MPPADRKHAALGRCGMIPETQSKSMGSIQSFGLMLVDPIHILRPASFTESRGHRCVRHYRQVTSRRMKKSS